MVVADPAQGRDANGSAPVDPVDDPGRLFRAARGGMQMTQAISRARDNMT